VWIVTAGPQALARVLRVGDPVHQRGKLILLVITGIGLY